MLKIYGVPHSRAFRVIWLANECGIAYEHIPVTFGVPNAQCKEPWYIALNPNGRVPTIDDDGLVMWESAAINLYLAEKYKSPLFPATLEGRGRMLQWAFFAHNDLEPLVITIFRNRIFFLPRSAMQRSRTRRRRHCEPNSRSLSGNLANPAISVAINGTCRIS